MKKAEAKAEKYKKRRQRLKAKQNDQPTPRTKTRKLLRYVRVPTEVRRTLTFHHALMDGIQERLSESTLKEKRKISCIISSGVVKKYRFLHCLQKAVGLSRRKPRLHPDGRWSRKLARTIVKMVLSFFDRDDVSRMAPGKKDTVTRFGDKRQKRLLCDTLKNFYTKFLADHPNLKLSYSSFCRLRPFWVRPPTKKDRQTCQCKQHENLFFLAQSLHKAGVCLNS